MNTGATHSDAFRAIADPTRRAILDLLRHGQRSVSELAEPFRMTQPAVSQHLRVLRDAGLVSQQRLGRRQIYRIVPEPLRHVYGWLAQYERFWHRKLDALGTYLGRKK
jgi:DNA-binding transcriptional ArsR family regulator